MKPEKLDNANRMHTSFKAQENLEKARNNTQEEGFCENRFRSLFSFHLDDATD